MAQGIRESGAGLDLEVDECPVADGGEGTADVLLKAIGGREVSTTAGDPLGRRITAGFSLLADGSVAVVETAAASGLGLVEAGRRDAVEASSAGTGELMLAAARSGADRILLAVGGTATTDGGHGAIEAIEAGGGLGGVDLVIFADVETAFEDAAAVFGPQKGATADEVRLLTSRLIEMAGRLPKSPLGVRRTGAGGGIAGGLWARYGAEVVSGADYVLDAIDFSSRLERCDRVLVGEGQLDSQSLDGKVVGQILRRATEAGRPCHAIAGRCQLDDVELEQAGFASVQTASSLNGIQGAAARVALRG
jgi:glycerate kinase